MSGINDQVGPRLYKTLEDITGLHKESKEARERSTKAEDKAASADWKSEITQKRLFEAVDGQEQLDETKMIRVDVEDGKVYPNASAKLDAVQQRTTAQLAQTAEEVTFNKVEADKEFERRGISINLFPRLIDEMDDAPRFRRAIAYIRKQVIDNGFKVITNLHVPANEYTFRSKVTVSPYVKMKIIGFVNFITEFEGSLFHIVSNDNDPRDFSQEYLRRNSWNRGELFDGSSGQLVIRSALDLGYKTTALEFGTNKRDQSNQIPTSRMLMKNVSIFGFDVALKFNTVNTYIFHFSDMHIEANNHIAVFGEPSIICRNSGENVVFANSVLASSRKSAFVYFSDNFDTLIHGCSLDFNISPMIVTHMGYKSIRISDSYIERLYEVEGKPALLEHFPRPDSHLQDVVRFTLENTVMLDDSNKQLTKTHAVSNQQSKALVSLENFDFRIRSRYSQYGDEQIFLVDNDSIILSNKVIYPIYAKGMISRQLNRFNEMGGMSNGSLASESHYYSINFRDGATEPRIAIVEGRRFITWNQEARDGFVQALSRRVYAKPGSQILISLALGLNSFSTGNIRAEVRFYSETEDIVGTVIDFMDGLSTTASYTNNNLIRPRNCAQFIVPKHAEYFTVRFQLSGLPVGNGIKMGDFQCNVVDI